MNPTSQPVSLSVPRRSNASPTPSRVEISPAATYGRAALEQFVREQFALAYGAQLRHFLPYLMSLRDDRGGIVAVLGFRLARTGRLFLEQYLDEPVEQVLGMALGRQTNRSGVVEVGNLASGLAGGARWLIAALTAYLKGAGQDWAVFTAVPPLRNAFERMGVELIPLAPARRERLPVEEQGQWGRYYESEPTVVAANVDQSFDALTAFLRDTNDRYRLMPLWQRAYVAGIFAEALRQ